jgi:hypothetical protein
LLGVALTLALQVPPDPRSLTTTCPVPVPRTAIQYWVPLVIVGGLEKLALFQPDVGELMVAVAKRLPGAPDELLYSPTNTPWAEEVLSRYSKALLAVPEATAVKGQASLWPVVIPSAKPSTTVLPTKSVPVGGGGVGGGGVGGGVGGGAGGGVTEPPNS